MCLSFPRVYGPMRDHIDTMWGVMAVLIKWLMESDPSEQFLFNFRKRCKHEKHMMEKYMDICG